MGRTIVRREFARTRANSPAFAANSPVFADCSPTFYFREHWRTIGEHSANSREHWRSSREFARIRAEFAANWRTVRQKTFFNSENRKTTHSMNSHFLVFPDQLPLLFQKDMQYMRIFYFLLRSNGLLDSFYNLFLDLDTAQPCMDLRIGFHEMDSMQLK